MSAGTEPRILSMMPARVAELAANIESVTQRIDDSAARVASIEVSARLAEIETRLRDASARIYCDYCEAVRRGNANAADAAD